MTTDIKELVKRLTATRTQRDLNWNDVTYPINPDGEEAALALEVLAGEVATLNASLGQAETERDEFADERDRLKETITTAVQFNEGLAAERDRLKAALVKFIAEADNAPKRIIGSGIGGQTMEATLQRAGRLVSEWQLGQLEEALGDAS